MPANAVGTVHAGHVRLRAARFDQWHYSRRPAEVLLAREGLDHNWSTWTGARSPAQAYTWRHSSTASSWYAGPVGDQRPVDAEVPPSGKRSPTPDSRTSATSSRTERPRSSSSGTSSIRSGATPAERRRTTTARAPARADFGAVTPLRHGPRVPAAGTRGCRTGRRRYASNARPGHRITPRSSATRCPVTSSSTRSRLDRGAAGRRTGGGRNSDMRQEVVDEPQVSRDHPPSSA